MGNSCGKQQEQQGGGGAGPAAVRKWGTAAGGRGGGGGNGGNGNGNGKGALLLPAGSASSAAAAAAGRAKARTRRGSTMATARALLPGGGGGAGGAGAGGAAAATAALPTGPVAVAPPPPPPSPRQAAAQQQQQQPSTPRRQRGSSCSDEAGGAAAAGGAEAPEDDQGAAAATANLAPAAAAVGGLVLSKLRSDCAVRDAYRLGRTLGKGGFAVVRLATDRATGVDWAVKVMALPRQGAVPGDNDNTVEDVLKEIDILCGLSHPNVVGLREYFAERGRVYLVTELVTGGELLGAVLARGACGERDARVAFTQLLRGIEYLHSRGVVHRDLKLENLLLSKPGQLRGLKIADFGLARRVPGWSGGVGGGGGGGGAFGGGVMSTVCGTPQYVAPEVIAGIPGLEYGPKVDAWSAGVVLFVLLGGYPPFWAESEPALFGLVRRGHFTFDDPVWAGVSDGAKDLIRRLLVVDPAQRLSAAEALQHAWIAEGLADVDDDPPPEGEQEKSAGLGALASSAFVPGAALPPIQSERGEA